jgi:hypothetical protein
MTDPIPTEITVDMTLKGPLAATLLRHAKRRKVRPIDLMADIVEAVLGDDIVDAVLDDGAAA